MSTHTTEALGINLGSLRYVPKEQFMDALEARVRELFKSNAGEWEFYYSEDDWIGRIKQGEALLWVAQDDDGVEAFMVAAVATHLSGKRCLYISHIGGYNLTTYIPAMFTAATKAGRLLDCDRIEMSGRDAWARFLSSYGVKTLSRTYYLDL